MTTRTIPALDYRALFADAPAPMLIVAADPPYFTITYVNAAYLSATMKQREQLVGLPLFEAMPDNPGDQAATGVTHLRTSMERAIATGLPHAMAVQKYDIAAPWGGFEERWWAPVNAPVLDDTGSVVAVIHHVTDATAQVRADTSLRRLNETLESQVAQRTAERDRIWQLSPHLLLVARIDGAIVSANPAWERILGWPPTTLMGRHLGEFEDPGEADHSVVEHMRLSAGQRVVDDEHRYRHQDGSWRWISWTVESEGELIYCNGRDVTLEREQAAALHDAHEALRQSQKMEAVGQLTGGLAHDFNNLLAGISGSLELIHARLQNGRVHDIDKYMAAALAATQRAAALTQRLLAFSRRQNLDPQPTNVDALVQGMLEMIRRTVGPGVYVEFSPAGEPWTVMVDPPQLENALLNLCINARDALPRGGQILIETRNVLVDEAFARQRDLPEGPYLVLQVRDTGTGMSPEVVERAFEPFFTTKPIGEGTGLGLSMIYSFAQQSAGRAHISSEVGHGTTVSLYLPRRHVPARAPQEPLSRRQWPRSEQGETVLIVDDEPTVRMLIGDILQELGYRAIEAGDSASGLDILESDVRIDLLVADVGLPGGMNGPQMAERARARRADLKVLFVTGYDEHVALGDGRFAPVTQVITKPFAIETMASRIRAMVMAP
jgi:PAS domain S-box-containing protein